MILDQYLFKQKKHNIKIEIYLLSNQEGNCAENIELPFKIHTH